MNAEWKFFSCKYNMSFSKGRHREDWSSQSNHARRCQNPVYPTSPNCPNQLQLTHCHPPPPSNCPQTQVLHLNSGLGIHSSLCSTVGKSEPCSFCCSCLARENSCISSVHLLMWIYHYTVNWPCCPHSHCFANPPWALWGYALAGRKSALLVLWSPSTPCLS